MPSPALLTSTTQRRTRSVGFLEHDGATWACYLITYRSAAQTWRGRLAFRSDGRSALDSEAGSTFRSVCTTEIFLEPSESAIDRKARQMGRPLLRALLSSAVEVEELTRQATSRRGAVRTWVRDALYSRTADEVSGRSGASEVSIQRSRYEAYRIDQMAHLMALMEPDALDRLVEEVLQGASFEFGAKDRLQFAMMVVQRLEALLPLPPLDAFLEDSARHPLEYERYHHDLYAGGDLP